MNVPKKEILQKITGPLVMFAVGFGFGYLLLPEPPDPAVSIKSVAVVPTVEADRTTLHITTVYENSGCSQTLLTRFLLNTRPTPSIALPQQQGPTVLPVGKTMIVEDVAIGFVLGAGNWHLFSVASCYRNGEPIPAATVAPTALFDIGSGS